MPRTRPYRWFVLSALLIIIGGGSVGADDKPKPADPKDTKAAPPKWPFEVKEPSARPSKVKDVDLKKVAPGDLSGVAMSAGRGKDYDLAVTLEYWAVKNGGGSQYNLACFYSLAGDSDAALYWLLTAGQEEGADPEHAAVDTDFANIRKDKRFKDAIKYLEESADYHRKNAKPVTLSYFPKKHDPKKPTHVLILLHGRGSAPSQFFGDFTQDLAETLGLPIVSVSGTQPTGPKRFVWSQDPKKDAERIDAALATLNDKLTIAPTGRITLGFSEGGQMAVEIAARDPEKYAGAIGMSPGADFSLGEAKADPKLKGKKFFVTIGTEEHPGNKSLADKDTDWLKKAGVDVELLKFKGIGHTLPEDFTDQLPKWVKAITNTK